MCVVTSCSDETTGSATDPLKYTYDKDKDTSVEPGNSFFDYCCGTWLKGHPTPADPNENIGGMFDALKVMKERERELKAEQPDIYRDLVRQSKFVRLLVGSGFLAYGFLHRVMLRKYRY